MATWSGRTDAAIADLQVALTQNESRLDTATVRIVRQNLALLENEWEAGRHRIEQKFLAGPELFDFACELARAGIRDQNPGADEAQVEALLRERLALARRLGR